MPESVRTCPNCGGNLSAPRFALQTVCPFCGSTVQLDPSMVKASRFRDAFAEWSDAEARGFRDVARIGGRDWALGARIARGETAEVFAGLRARHPAEAVVVRIARDPADASRIDRAWDALDRLQRSGAKGAHVFLRRLPEPIAHGIVETGPWKNRAAIVTRWAHGHTTTLARIGRIDAASSVWVWRRILEALAFVHASGLGHGAITPAHVLIEGGEHGARLVGFGNAGELGTPITGYDARYRPIYPDDLLRGGLSVRDDLRMTARTIAVAIGGDPSRGTVDAPGPYAAVLRAVATSGQTPQGDKDAWALRERLDEVGKAAFGPAKFRPLVGR